MKFVVVLNFLAIIVTSTSIVDGFVATTTSSVSVAPKVILSNNNNKKHNYNSSCLNMCICIDCARVTNCEAYHFVETKHEQPHMTENPTFTPRDGSPTIHVNIRTNSNNDDTIKRMWKEHATETAKAEEKAATNSDGQTTTLTELHGDTVYDMSSATTTIEYDVVACADYIEDVGCWVRNMPNEIKKANPNFVPT